MTRRRRNQARAFTITEMLLAMMITGMILTAVASLTYAVSRLWAHNGAGDSIGILQHNVSRRVADLIRRAQLVLDMDSCRIRLWGSDLDQDGLIDLRELVEIYYDAHSDRVERIQYDVPESVAPVAPEAFATSSGWTNAVLNCQSAKKTALLADGVTDWSIAPDAAAPLTRTITVDFTIRQGEVTRTTTFAATMRSRDETTMQKILEARTAPTATTATP